MGVGIAVAIISCIIWVASILIICNEGINNKLYYIAKILFLISPVTFIISLFFVSVGMGFVMLGVFLFSFIGYIIVNRNPQKKYDNTNSQINTTVTNTLNNTINTEGKENLNSTTISSNSTTTSDKN